MAACLPLLKIDYLVWPSSRESKTKESCLLQNEYSFEWFEAGKTLQIQQYVYQSSRFSIFCLILGLDARKEMDKNVPSPKLYKETQKIIKVAFSYNRNWKDAIVICDSWSCTIRLYFWLQTLFNFQFQIHNF